MNPTGEAMVFLYYDLAGLSPPTDRWVEQDRAVELAEPADKATARDAARSKIAAAAAAVRDVGLISLTLDAQLSRYDPTYSEFTIGALSPGSRVTFNAFDETVSVEFANALDVQHWKVPAADAQSARDRVGQYPDASIDLVGKVVDVQPGVAGGTIVVQITSYQLINRATGATLTKMDQVP